jgi:uncharacterized protein (TIGR01732 family)
MEKMKYGPYDMPGKGYEMPEMGGEQQAPMMYSAPMQQMPTGCCYGTPHHGRGNSFALFVVLFILLIIIGAACKF